MKLTEKIITAIANLHSKATFPNGGHKMVLHPVDDSAVRDVINTILSTTLPDAPALTVTLEEANAIRQGFLGETGGESMQRVINAVLARRPAAQAQEPHISVMPAEQERHEFENFHRVLCERFGYCHDPVDWKRDQASLIEHIASLIPASALEQQRIAAILSRHGYTWSQDDAKKIAGEIIAELADKEKSQ